MNQDVRIDVLLAQRGLYFFGDKVLKSTEIIHKGVENINEIIFTSNNFQTEFNLLSNGTKIIAYIRIENCLKFKVYLIPER